MTNTLLPLMIVDTPLDIESTAVTIDASIRTPSTVTQNELVRQVQCTEISAARMDKMHKEESSHST
ncbi:hypothetical protein ACIGGF_03520 [Rhodococcus sp. NPDC078407]|uniref:hypothetical protein n=1 Tax=Rhodococcus sp. NPDC078407 TaxID=3364509 RepID=UPI0037C6DE3C